MNNSDDDLVVRLGMVVEDALPNPKGGKKERIGLVIWVNFAFHNVAGQKAP